MSTETQFLSKGAFDTSAYNALIESTAAGVREGLREQVETKRNEIFDQLRARVKEAASGLKDDKLDRMIDNMKTTNWKEVAKEVGLAATSAFVPKLLAQFGTATGLAVTAAEAEAVAAGTKLVPLLGAAEAGEVAAVGAEAAAGAGAVGVLEGLSLSNPWTAVVFGLAAGSYFLFKDRKKGPGGPAHHLKQGDWVIIDDGFKIRNKYGGMGGEMEYERIRMHSPGFFIEPTPGKDSLRQDVYNFNSGRVESKGFRDLMLMPPTEVEAVVKTKVLPLVRDLWFADESWSRSRSARPAPPRTRAPWCACTAGTSRSSRARAGCCCSRTRWARASSCRTAPRSASTPSTTPSGTTT